MSPGDQEPDIGYCQGMSEVAAVFLHEFSLGGGATGGDFSGGGGGGLGVNEAECYACLAHFLFRFRRNFLVNNEGILVGGVLTRISLSCPRHTALKTRPEKDA